MSAMACEESDKAAAPPPQIAEWVRGDCSALPELLRRHRVLLLVLFGSTVKGRRHPGSDLDLAVLFEGPPQHGSFYRDEIELEEALDTLLMPACELNLVALNRVEAPLQKEVADHGLVLFADTPSRWMLYRIRARRNYEDTEKFRRRRRQAFEARYGDPHDRPGTGEEATSVG
jgi:predicted nucleotidyltransferase